MIKLIVSDLDETLLGADGSISEANKIAIRKAREAGVKFVPNTGRGFASVQPLLKKLDLYDLPDQYVISFNGGAIVENKDQKVLATNGLTFEQASQIFDITRQYKDYDTHIYTLNDVYIYNVQQEDADYLKTRGVDLKYTDDENLNRFKNDSIMKLLTMHPDMEKRREMKDIILSKVDFDLNVTFSSDMYTEFNHASTDKGSATLELAKRLGIKKDEIMALGDNSNDLPMLKSVGMPVVVSNASKEAKEVAKYVTDADYVSGVAEAINRFVLN